MERKAEYIEIVFENCEEVRLTPDKFRYMFFEGVKNNISINCWQYEEGEASEYKTCEYFQIEIKEEGLKTMAPMQDIELKERLRYCDIVSIWIKYKDGEEEKIYVDWSEEEEYRNSYQMNQIVEEGIEVKIGKEASKHE